VAEIDKNGQGLGIIDRPVVASSKLLLFDAETALRSPAISLVATDRIDGVVATWLRYAAGLNLRHWPWREWRSRIWIGIGYLARWFEQNARRLDSACPILRFIVGRVSSDLGASSPLARGGGPNVVQPLANLAEVLIEDFGDLFRLRGKATRLFRLSDVRKCQTGSTANVRVNSASTVGR
jgi:hypothetical protein